MVAEDVNQNDFLASFGLEEGTTPEPEPTEPEPIEDEGVGAEGDSGTAEGNESQTEPEPEPKPTEPPNNPANAAFAQMRVLNQQYKGVIDGVAKVLGVQDLSNPNAVLDQVNQLVLQAQAKQENVPVELLQRLTALEAQNNQYTQQQLQQQALIGFERVKTEYNLSNEDLTEFADQLQKSGVNPFTSQVDLITEYKNLNFEKLMEQAVEKGIQQERERSTRASKSGTTPNKGTGGDGPDSPDKINSVSDLTSFFKSQG